MAEKRSLPWPIKLRNKSVYFLVFFTILSGMPAGNISVAQEKEFSIQKDDRLILFLGDSITAGQEYTSLIETYVLTRFPDWKTKFRNVGVPGDTATLHVRSGYGKLTFDQALERDVLSQKPSLVFINF